MNHTHWVIPVTWECCGTVAIPKSECPTLAEAIEKCNDKSSDIGLPAGNYVDGSFCVSMDDIETIRQCCNNNATDESPRTNEYYSITIVRQRMDGLDVEVYTSSYILDSAYVGENCDEKDIADYFRSVVAKFLATKEGQIAFMNTHRDFNWGDIGTYIPEAFLNSHGIISLSQWKSNQWYNYICDEEDKAIKLVDIIAILVNQDEILGEKLDDDIMFATYTSVWSDGIEISSPCKVNLETKEVFDIETNNVTGIEGHCVREYFTFDDDVEHDVVEASDCESNETGSYWRQ